MYVLILNFPFLAIKSEYLKLKNIRMAGSLFEEQKTSGLYNIKCKNITSNLIAIKVLVWVILRRKHHFHKIITILYWKQDAFYTAFIYWFYICSSTNFLSIHSQWSIQ